MSNLCYGCQLSLLEGFAHFAQALLAAIAVLQRKGSFLCDSSQAATFSSIAGKVRLLAARPFLNVGEDLWQKQIPEQTADHTTMRLRNQTAGWEQPRAQQPWLEMFPISGNSVGCRQCQVCSHQCCPLRGYLGFPPSGYAGERSFKDSALFSFFFFQFTRLCPPVVISPSICRF